MKMTYLPLLYFSLLLLASAGCNPSQSPGTPKPAEEASATVPVPQRTFVDRNPLKLLDVSGHPAETTLLIGESTTVVKDTTRKSSVAYSHLWIDLADKERDRWINTPGFGEGGKYGSYVKTLIENERILPVAIGTRVLIDEVQPDKTRKYCFTYFKVVVENGKFKGRTGWLSYFGLVHPHGK